MELSSDIMFQASLEKNPEFEGVFWMAVKTTGIFCRPTCTARKPKKENVEFFPDPKLALDHGYRPCKICKPLHNPTSTPEDIQQIINEISENPELKLKDEDLLTRGLSPVNVRRWFVKNYGITFHNFQRRLKINAAYKKLQQGDAVLDAALDSGYESLSGFADRFKNILGVSPKQSASKNIINFQRIETPLGNMIACATNSGICMLEFSDRKTLHKELNSIAQYFGAQLLQGENQHLELLKKELSAYFEGKLKIFTVKLSPVGTDFQKEVWQALQTIPYGTTRNYQQQAEILKKPKAVRAVANANGLNKISILIPCHRVIGSNGTLTGYGGGIWRKQKLLELEKSILF